MKRKLLRIVITMAMIFALIPTSIAMACSCDGEDYFHDGEDGSYWHGEKVYTRPATTTQSGKYEGICDYCGEAACYGFLPAIDTVRINSWEEGIDAENTFSYDGEEVKPNIYVKDEEGDEIEEDYYDITYNNNLNVGTATAVVTFKWPYSGTEELTFNIIPKSPYFNKITYGKNSATLNWKRGSAYYDGYEIKYSTDSNFKKSETKTKNVKGGSTASLKLTGLMARVTYYAQIRAYKTVNGEKIYSQWSWSDSRDGEFEIPVKKAHATTIKLNKNVTVGPSVGYYKFTAPKKGCYLISTGEMSWSNELIVENKSGKELKNLDENEASVLSLNKGQTIYLLYDSYYEEDSEKSKIKVSNSSILNFDNDEFRGKLNTKTWTFGVAPKAVTEYVYYDGSYTVKDVNKKIKKIELGDGVVSIAYPALREHTNLKEITLPETLKRIDQMAFIGAPKLKKLAVPPSVTSLSTNVFEKGIKLYGQEGSAIEAYAEANKHTFVKVLDSPVIKVAKKSKSKATISWKKVKNASKYEVWKKTGKSGTYKKIATTKKTSYTNGSLKKGKVYYYKVKAIYTKDPYKNSFFSKEKKYTAR